MDQPDEVLISIVEKYNIRTKKSTEIIRERCGWVDDKNTNGFVLENLCIQDGKICGIGRVTEDGAQYFISTILMKTASWKIKHTAKRLRKC
jgi:hypothetical protein